MARLFRLDDSGNLATPEEQRFLVEVNEMEPFIRRNPRVLGDVLIFGERTISSGRQENRLARGG